MYVCQIKRRRVLVFGMPSRAQQFVSWNFWRFTIFTCHSKTSIYINETKTMGRCVGHGGEARAPLDFWRLM